MKNSISPPAMPETAIKALDRVLGPIGSAHGLPNSCYTDPECYDIERRQVLADGWVCVGFSIDVPGPGDLFPLSFAELPLLIVRSGDGVVRLFHNVCAHRGRILVDTPAASRKAVICPYHRWSYDLDGELIATPNVGGPGQHDCPGFEKRNVRLSEIRSAEWRGLIFADLSGAAEEFTAFIGPLESRWAVFAGASLIHTGIDSTIEFALGCNWKLAVENYCEAYHLPWIHPDLNRISPLDQHHPIVEDAYAGQISERYAPAVSKECKPFPVLPGLNGFWKNGAEYIALFPNVLLGLHRDHYYAVLIQPEGPGRTRERLEIFYFHDAARGKEYEAARRENRARWLSVFAEDQGAVEGMQRGRLSPGYDGGVFSPAMDRPTHAFHKWIAQAMLQGRQSRLATAE